MCVCVTLRSGNEGVCKREGQGIWRGSGEKRRGLQSIKEEKRNLSVEEGVK